MESPPSLLAFVTVAETLSFAAAARKLGLSPSATGKAIAALEAQLGVRLFTRTTRRVSLTPEGELLLRRARRLQEDWRETTALLSASAREPQGLLRISLPAAGYRFLAPHLAEFTQVHPKIRLDLDFDDRIKDLVTGGFDLAIRSGELPDSGMTSRKLPPFRLSVYAAPSYLAEYGEPDAPAMLAAHRLIRFRHPDTDVLQAWRLASGTHASVEETTPHVICSNIEAVRAAAIAGLGLAWGPDFLMHDAVEAGELRLVLPAETIDAAFWLLWPSGRYGSTRLRAFIDFATRRLFGA